MKITIYDGSKPAYDVDLNKFNKEIVSFGRQADSDIVFSSQHVSRVHGCFYLENGEWHIHDMDSTNGVTVNGAQLKDSALTLNAKIYLYKSSTDSVYMVVKDIGAGTSGKVIKTSPVAVPVTPVNTTKNNIDNSGSKPANVSNNNTDKNIGAKARKSIAFTKKQTIIISSIAAVVICVAIAIVVITINKNRNVAPEPTKSEATTTATTAATTESTTEKPKTTEAVTTTEAASEAAVTTEATTEVTTEVTTEATTEATTEMVANYDDIYADVIWEYNVLTHDPNSIEPDVYLADEANMTIHDWHLYDGKVEINNTIQFENITYGYAYYDIDKNGVKEMIISQIDNDKIYAIYTYYNGKVYGLTGSDSRVEIHVYKDGLIVVEHDGSPGCWYKDYTYIDKDKLVAKGLYAYIEDVEYCKDHDINQKYYMDADYYYNRMDELDLYNNVSFEFDKPEFKYEEVSFSYTNF